MQVHLTVSTFFVVYFLGLGNGIEVNTWACKYIGEAATEMLISKKKPKSATTFLRFKAKFPKKKWNQNHPNL